MKTIIKAICLASMLWMAFGDAIGQITFVENDGKVSMMNGEGKLVVEFQKNEDSWVIDDFQDGWGRIRVNGKTGLADSNGWIVEPQDGDLYLFDGFYSLQTLDTERIITSLGVWSRDGKCLLEPTENVYAWRYGTDKVLPIKFKGKFGIMDKTGWVVEPTYDEMEWYSDDMLPACKGRLWGFFDAEGHLAIPLQFKWVRRFNEGMAGANVDGKWGFIDKTGKMVIEPRFTSVGIFSEGLAAVVGDEHMWGYIDKTGKVVIKPQFDQANPFDETGRAWVSIGYDETEVNGYVDKDGNFTPKE